MPPPGCDPTPPPAVSLVLSLAAARVWRSAVASSLLHGIDSETRREACEEPVERVAEAPSVGRARRRRATPHGTGHAQFVDEITHGELRAGVVGIELVAPRAQPEGAARNDLGRKRHV